MGEQEIKRLAGRPPLVTILILMIGPLCSQITSTLYGIINTIWISKYIGEVGMSAVATDIAWELIARSFGLFLSIAASSQISALFGQKKFEECEQVACDLYRTAFICGMIVPAILIPINKPFSRWFKATPETVDLAFDYILPQVAGNVFTCIFYTNVGFLQAEGRTLLVGCIDIVALGIGMGILNPLFLGTFKTGIAGPSYSTIIADGVPGIILTILYFSGKFGVKPKLKGLLKPFNKSTFQALLTGSSQLISQISTSIPGIILRRLIGLSLENPTDYDLAMAAFNVVCRYTGVAAAVVLALCTGFLPAASYAYAAKLYHRYVRLSIHLNWVDFMWCLIVMIFGMWLPVQIGKLFGSDEDYLRWCIKELPAANWGTFIFFARFTIQTMLQSQQRGKRAMIISFISNFVVSIASVYLLYYLYPAKTERLLWSFSISSVVGFVLGTALLIKPFYRIIMIMKGKIVEDDKEKVESEEKYSLDDSKYDSKYDETENDEPHPIPEL